jgi:HlyD family secretion protein
MKKLITIIIVLIAIGAVGAAYYVRRGGPEPTVTTLQISRGDVVDQVGATGTLQAVTTVQVGTQVSGTVDELYADFNSIVKKGQVIARLDPSILQTQVDTAKANLVNAEANLERQKAAVEDAQTKLSRARELAARSLLPKADLDAAEATAKQAAAQLRSTESQIVQAKAAVNKAQVDLGHTVITAPIDGIVISRNVDRGQTVAASMQAPTLFVIAADLTKMQVNANIDESDVGRMRPGQLVHFRVDAYPTEQFLGIVQQVRLNPTTVQNVVTYSTVIDVPNPELKLKPGMTANVNIEIARKSNVLRVPNTALRFRPTRDTFVALNQEITPDIERALGGGRAGFGRGGQNAQAGQPGQPARSTPPQPGQAPQPPGTATAGQATAAQQGPRGTATAGQSANESNRPGDQQSQPRAQGNTSAQDGSNGSGRGGMDPEERRRRMEERLARMTPEERAAFEQRMRERQAQGGFGGPGGFPGGGQGQGPGGQGQGPGGQGQGPGGQGQGMFPGGPGQNPQNAGASNRPPQRGQPAANNPRSVTSTNASTIDSLFGPLPTVETRGRAWLYMNKQLKPVNLRLGISDGTYTEILDGDGIQPGTEVVTNVVTGAEATQRPGGNTTGNPLLQQPGRPGGPSGFGGGGGRGGRG